MKGGTRKRGNTWSYYFDAAHVGGKRKKIEKGGFRTKKEAETALAKAISEYDNSGQTFTPAEISVSDYLDFWFDNYHSADLAENSKIRYTIIINNHLKPAIGAYRLKSLQAATVQDFVVELKAKGLSKSTITGTVSLLSSALDYAIHPLQYIKENPCRFVKIGKMEGVKEKTVISDDDFNRIISMFPAGSRYYMHMVLGWYCGLRAGECTGLEWNDIDFENRTISIKRQYTNETLKSPKYNSVRVVDFGETLFKILQNEKKRQSQNELKYGEYYTIYTIENEIDENGRKKALPVAHRKADAPTQQRFSPICVTENGELITPRKFKLCHAKISKNLNINFSHHALRHTHATRLIEAGANVKAVQTRLGHKDISTTMNTYVHYTPEMGKETAALFERISKNATR